MFIKISYGLLNLDSVTLLEAVSDGKNWMVVAWLNWRTFANDSNSITVYSGTEKQCQAYMTELEKELAAFGKLIRVEVD